MIVLHNTLDGIRPEQFGSAHWLWRLLHVRGPLSGVGRAGRYPLIPWIGVMGAGYCFGRVFDLEPDRRRRLLVRLGLGLADGVRRAAVVESLRRPVPVDRASRRRR